MKYIVFDVETTGLSRKDEVIQFSCIITDQNLIAKKFCNFYCYTQQPIAPNAFNVHKISKEDLYRKSGGRSFEDSWLELEHLFGGDDVTWVDWSTSGFDQRMIDQTLVNNGLEPYFTFSRVSDFAKCASGRHSFNLMEPVAKKFGKRSMKLEEAERRLGYGKEQLDRLYQQMVGGLSPVLQQSSGYHHADYDAFITYVVLYRFFS